MKIATVIPIPKGERTKLIEEYRGINTLPSLEMLLEVVVHQQLTDFLSKYNLLSPNHSGFRGGYSWETALQKLINKWKYATDNNLDSIVVFLDLKRAFELFDRDILLIKLKNYFGFDEGSLK